MNAPFLPDTRPYPSDSVKSDLLLYAHQILHQNGATQKLARENLLAQIANAFQFNQTLALSVALNMSPNRAVYATLMDAIAEVINAKNPEEQQWIALPVVLVAGSKTPTTLNTNMPIDTLNQVCAQHEHLHTLPSVTWHQHLLTAEDFAHIQPKQWFAAKQNRQAANAFLHTLPTQSLSLNKPQSVNVLYAVGFGSINIQAALSQALQQAAMPLMKVWQDAFHQDKLTLFANPLPPNNPIHALTRASAIRTQMALEVFSANAIRHIRLQSPRVGVILAAQENGKLLFGFDSAEPTYELPTQIFTWHLSPHDDIPTIQQYFISLMMDCQVENLYLLHDVLPEKMALPSYHKAHEFKGHNPLFT